MNFNFINKMHKDIFLGDNGGSTKKRILILGHARHGKDTLANYLKEMYGYKFLDSSRTACKLFIFERMKERWGYKTEEECYNDRVNYRGAWFAYINDYNKYDKARLAKLIMRESDIYVGMRNIEEVRECKEQGIFDLVIGIYNQNKVEESFKSFNVNIWEECDLILPSGESPDDLKKRLIKLKDLFI